MSRSLGGVLPDALAPRTAIRPSRTGRQGRPGRHAGERRLAARGAGDGLRPRTANGSSRRRSSRRAGRPAGRPRERDAGAGAAQGGPAGPAHRWDPPAPQDRGDGPRRRPFEVARVEPEPPPQPLGGSTVGLSDWERWLEFCARIDGFPRHLAIHSGGMLVTAAPLIDIAPTRAGDDEGPRRRPVRQARRRGAQADQARPARARDARRDRRDAPADRARLRRLPRPRPAAGGGAGGLRDAPGGRHRRGLPGREPGPDADAAEVDGRRAWTTSSSRSRSSGRARSRATPSIRTCAGSRAWSR